MFALLAAATCLSGCIVADVAGTAVEIAKVPVKVVSAGVDAATTSQSEADEKRGRELRKEEERLGRENRLRDQRCREGRPLHTDICTSPPRER